MFEVNSEINKYLEFKPKYFNRNEIRELITFLNNMNEYIKGLEAKQKNCRCDYLNNENKLLKIKLSTIKYNLENIEIDNKIQDSIHKKEKGMYDIIILLEEIKKESNYIIKFAIYFLLFILKYLYYIYNLC